ncbi:acyltransferase family protein [Ruicaihuangia caeni]|uniref:acyltransferase family protein n=1 Tax=Ruicaihuangia caeni TaxID=3042517 RepID=UPI003390015D
MPEVHAAQSPNLNAAQTAGPSTARNAGRLLGLDGMRAVAVTAVLAFHLLPGVLPGGFLGVDLFFVISGFLITTLLLREHARSGRIDLVDFWRRRARRLLPAIGLLVVVTASAALAIGGDALHKLGWQVLGTATFSYNWLSIADGNSYFDSTSPELLRNLWSLAVEEQFYLVWPLVLLALLVVRRRWVRVALVAAAAAASAVTMGLLVNPADPTRVYFGTDTHSFGLTIGIIVALLMGGWPDAVGRWPRAVRPLLMPAASVAMMGIVAAFVWLDGDALFAYRGGLVAVSLLTALVLAAAVAPGSALGRALEWAPFRWIGTRSYGLYLWHWPVYVLLLDALPTWQGAEFMWPLAALSLAITVVAAELSYRFVEQPVRRLGFRATLSAYRRAWDAPRSRIAAAAITAVVATAGTATVVAIALDPGTSSAQSQIARGQAALDDTASSEPRGGGQQGDGSEAGAGEAGAGSASPADRADSAALPSGDQITAIGDSVMLAVVPQLQAQFPGIRVDAVVSRQMRQAPELLQQEKDAGTLRDTIVVGLGTNGSIGMDTLERVREIAGPERRIVLVNVQAPRGWTPEVNAALSEFAQRYRNVELANWRDAIAPRLDLLARDQIHAGGDAAGAVYASALRDALQRLALLPPVLDRHDYWLGDLPQ